MKYQKTSTETYLTIDSLKRSQPSILRSRVLPEKNLIASIVPLRSPEYYQSSSDAIRVPSEVTRFPREANKNYQKLANQILQLTKISQTMCKKLPKINKRAKNSIKLRTRTQSNAELKFSYLKACMRVYKYILNSFALFGQELAVLSPKLWQT